MLNLELINKIKRSHTLVYNNAKMFFIDRITIIFALVMAILLYYFLIDDKILIKQTISYISIFTFILLLVVDYILYPFIFKYLIGEGIDGVWEGEFIIKENNRKDKLHIKKFEVMDFGKKCLIRVETDAFISYSVVAKLINKQENSIELSFIYEVIYKNSQNKNDHYGMTVMTFYKDGSIKPKGHYYTRDNGILRYGQIILDRKIKK